MRGRIAPVGRYHLGVFTIGATIHAIGCGSTYHEAHEFQGQVYYTERAVPDPGERFAHALTHDCSGGVRDDERALRLVPAGPGCTREELIIDYVPDGLHRVQSCTERWKIRCTKSSTRAASPQAQPPPFPTAPLDCTVDCVVEDHFAAGP